MKTFKLITLQIFQNEQLINIPLEDGLIINKEDEQNNWLIEGYMDKGLEQLFTPIFEKKDKLLVQVVITKKENDPAPFIVTPIVMNRFENHISVLFEGKLKKSRNDFAEQILEELIKEGYSGDELLTIFKEKIHNEPRISSKK